MNLQQRKADSEERGHAIQEKQVERPAERDQQRARKTAATLVGKRSAVRKTVSPEPHVDIKRAQENCHPPPAARDGGRNTR
jgi:hypothetical protein